MNTPSSISSEQKKLLNIISNNWENLDESQKTILIRIWKVLTYKWQLQIIFNLPFLVWWALDKYVAVIHKFDISLLKLLHVPDWALSIMGLSHLST